MQTCPACGYFMTTAACCHCPGATRASPDGPMGAPGARFCLLDVVDGFREVFRGGALLFTRPEFAGKLRGAIIANVIVVPAVVVLLWLGLHELFVWARQHEWGPFVWLRQLPTWLDAIAAVLLALLGVLMLLPVLVESVTAPFLDPIADTTEKMLGGPGMTAEPIPWTRSLATGAALGARLLLVQIAVFAISLLLSFCGFGLVIAFLASAWLAALVWFDIPLARRGYPLAMRSRVLRKNWARALGFGIGFQVALLVPLFNLVLLTPAAAVATSALFLRFEKPR